MGERGEEGVARPGEKGNGERGAISDFWRRKGLFCSLRLSLASDLTGWVTSGRQALRSPHWVTPGGTLRLPLVNSVNYMGFSRKHSRTTCNSRSSGPGVGGGPS